MRPPFHGFRCLHGRKAAAVEPSDSVLADFAAVAVRKPLQAGPPLHSPQSQILVLLSPVGPEAGAPEPALVA